MSGFEFRKVMVVGAGASGIQIAAQVAAARAARRAGEGRDAAFEDGVAGEAEGRGGREGVVVVDPADSVRASLRERLTHILESMATEGMIGTDRVKDCVDRVEMGASPEAVCADVDLVIECVPEDLETKREVLHELNRVCDPAAIFTSNTSFLIASMLAQASGRAAQLACLHFHPPVRHANLVDVMPGPATLPAVVERLVRFAKSIRQVPLVFSRENPGYLFNSLLAPWLMQAIDLVAREVATEQEIDRAWVCVTKSPFGPFAVLDNIGIPLVRQFAGMLRERSPERRRARIERYLQRFIDRGEMGQMTGKGVYSYPRPEFLEPTFVPEGIWSRDWILELQRRFRSEADEANAGRREKETASEPTETSHETLPVSVIQREPFIPDIGARVQLTQDLVSPEGNELHIAGSQGMVVGREDDRLRVRFHDRVEAFVPAGTLLLVTERAPDERSSAQVDESLMARVILRTVVGSRAYGLEDAESDADYRGVYLAPADRHWSLLGVPEQLERDSTQEVYWELQRFLILGLKANPNVLETMYSPIVVSATAMGEGLRELRDAFLSRAIYRTYAGYVTSQFRKFRSLREARKSPKQKHMMHLLRLLISGADALRYGELTIRVHRERDRLLAVKRGEMQWEEIDEWRKELEADFELAFQQTRLPQLPDQERVDAFLQQARQHAARELMS